MFVLAGPLLGSSVFVTHASFAISLGRKFPPTPAARGFSESSRVVEVRQKLGVEGKRLNSQSAAERLWLEGRIAMVTAAFARLLPAACSSGPAALTGPKVSQEKRRCRDVLEHNCTSSILAGLRAAGPHWLASSLDQTSAVWTEPAGSVWVEQEAVGRSLNPPISAAQVWLANWLSWQ